MDDSSENRIIGIHLNTSETIKEIIINTGDYIHYCSKVWGQYDL